MFVDRFNMVIVRTYLNFSWHKGIRELVTWEKLIIMNNESQLNIPNYITSAIYEIVHFRWGTVAEDEDISLDGLNTRSLLDIARHFRIDLWQIMTQMHLDNKKKTLYVIL